MSRGPGTPPPYDDIPQTPQAKRNGDNQRLSHYEQQQASTATAHPQNEVTSKLDHHLAIEGHHRLSLSPAPSRSLTPIYLDSNFRLPGEARDGSTQSAWQRFWHKNKPSILVALSQFFGATMNLTARLLEFDGEGMHPVQVLLMRQSLTAACCCIYMWWMKTPHFPLGAREIRPLLLFRGFSGFFGIFGMWYSMMYLPLADATVITFLAPGVAGFICWFALHEPFTRTERWATLVALMGVVLISRPTAFFGRSKDNDGTETEAPSKGGLPGADHQITPEERLMAIGVALLGVLGAACAFTTLRTIGKRAHPLISVNYFCVVSTIICTLALIVGPAADIGQPGLRWVTPTSVRQWVLMFLVGIIGFVMQYLLTAGLGADKSNRANAMVYTHMLFAAAYDRWVFKHEMGLMSFLGCALILGSAIGVVLTKKAPISKTGDVERQQNVMGESESAPMLLSTAGNVNGLGYERR